MHVRVYVHVGVCVSGCMCVHACMRVCMSMCMHTHGIVRVQSRVCIHVPVGGMCVSASARIYDACTWGCVHECGCPQPSGSPRSRISGTPCTARPWVWCSRGNRTLNTELLKGERGDRVPDLGTLELGEVGFGATGFRVRRLVPKNPHGVGGGASFHALQSCVDLNRLMFRQGGFLLNISLCHSNFLK